MNYLLLPVLHKTPCYRFVPGNQKEVTIQKFKNYTMSNLTKKELRYEIWAMLPDKCKKIMENIKETYLDSMIADAESFSNGQILKILKDEYGCNGILSIEWAATKKRQLKVYFKNNKPMKFKNHSAIIDFIREENFANYMN